MMISAAIIGYGIQIWSTVDAVRVAKVMNIGLRENSGFDKILYIKPFIQNDFLNENNIYGMTMSLKF